MNRQDNGVFFCNVIIVLILEIHSFPQFDEQKEQVAIEQILRVVFLDPERSTPVSVVCCLTIHRLGLVTQC